MDQISSSLKTIQEQLLELNKEWEGGKGCKGFQNNMIVGFHPQVTALGVQLEKLIKSMKTTQGLNCKIEDASSQGRRNEDHLDELDQRSLMGKISINVQDPELKKKIGILESGDYNNFNLNLLVTEVNVCYKTSIDADHDYNLLKGYQELGP